MSTPTSRRPSASGATSPGTGSQSTLCQKFRNIPLLSKRPIDRNICPNINKRLLAINEEIEAVRKEIRSHQELIKEKKRKKKEIESSSPVRASTGLEAGNIRTLSPSRRAQTLTNLSDQITTSIPNLIRSKNDKIKDLQLEINWLEELIKELNKTQSGIVTSKVIVVRQKYGLLLSEEDRSFHYNLKDNDAFTKAKARSSGDLKGAKCLYYHFILK